MAFYHFEAKNDGRCLFSSSTSLYIQLYIEMGEMQNAQLLFSDMKECLAYSECATLELFEMFRAWEMGLFD